MSWSTLQTIYLHLLLVIPMSMFPTTVFQYYVCVLPVCWNYQQGHVHAAKTSNCCCKYLYPLFWLTQGTARPVLVLPIRPLWIPITYTGITNLKCWKYWHIMLVMPTCWAGKACLENCYCNSIYWKSLTVHEKNSRMCWKYWYVLLVMPTKALHIVLEKPVCRTATARAFIGKAWLYMRKTVGDVGNTDTFCW